MTSVEANRIALFGDSIAAGLGVRDLRYGQIVAAQSGLELVDYSVSGATTAESLDQYEQQPQKVRFAIIAHGITEPIPRPPAKTLTLLPPRWRRRGWMDPRPYYSSRLRKRVLERLESSARWRVKNLLMWLAGHEQLMTPDDYRRDLNKLVEVLRARGATPVILGPPAIDDRFFPGASEAQARYASIARATGADFIDVDGLLSRWDDYFLDHFHPNEDGHRKIAEALILWLNRELKNLT